MSAPESFSALTPRQQQELVSLAGFPQLALDDEAAQDLDRLGLVRRTNLGEPGTARYEFTDKGRAVLPPEQHERLANTERAAAGMAAALAGIRRKQAGGRLRRFEANPRGYEEGE